MAQCIFIANIKSSETSIEKIEEVQKKFEAKLNETLTENPKNESKE